MIVARSICNQLESEFMSILGSQLPREAVKSQLQGYVKALDILNSAEVIDSEKSRLVTLIGRVYTVINNL